MFDADNQTNEEEILEQGITEVLIKTKNMADQIVLQQAAAAALESNNGEQPAEKVGEFYVNGKRQLIKAV